MTPTVRTGADEPAAGLLHALEPMAIEPGAQAVVHTEGGRPPRQVRRVVTALSISTFVEWAGASAVLPLLPLYLRREGATDLVVGATMAVFFLAAVAVQYPVGRLSDRVGRRPVQIAGLLTYAAASLAFAAIASPTAAIVFRALQGAGAGVVDVASAATVGEVVPAAWQGRAYGRLFGSRIAGLAIGPFFGGLVGVANVRWVFVAAACASILACVPVLIVIPRAGRRVVVAAHRRLVLWRDRGVLGVAFGYAAGGLVVGLYEVCWSLLLHYRGATAWQIGLSWTLFSIPFAVMSIPAGWLVDRADRRLLAGASILVSAGFAVLYPFVDNVWVLVVLGGAEAVSMALTGPALASQLAHRVAGDDLGRAQGGVLTAQTGTTAVAALLAGGLFAIAPWVPFVATGAGLAICVAGMAICWRHVPGREPRPAATEVRAGR